MPPIVTTILLAIAALASIVAAALAIARIVGRAAPVRAQRAATLVVAIICTALFFHQWIVVNDFQPVEHHVDGLILLGALLAWALLYLELISAMRSLAAFGLPVLALLLLWAVCASQWTLRPFDGDHSLIATTHRIGVYVGSLFIALAASAGVLYLVSQKRLRAKALAAEKKGDRLPSLEKTEWVIIRCSAFGFALLTVGMVTGLVWIFVQKNNQLGEGWWYSPKVVLSFAAWLIYALVTNVKHATAFRGSRAAWLAIFGLVVLLTVFGLVNAWSGDEPKSTRAPDVDPQNSVMPATAGMTRRISVERIYQPIPAENQEVAVCKS